MARGRGDRRDNVGPPGITEGAAILGELRTSNRLLAVLATKGLEQKQAIAFLDSVGFQPLQIAAALGITANTVRVALHRLRKATQAAPEGGARPEENRDDAK